MRSDVDLEAFVASEYPQVVAAVRLITREREAAADAVQDVLADLISRPPRRAIDNVAAYVTTAASNRVRDAQRRRGAEQRALTRVPREREQVAPASTGLDVDLERALAALPERQREICVHHYLLDHSVEQIARAMSVSPGTVKTQLHRARRTLARTLDSSGGQS